MSLEVQLMASKLQRQVSVFLTIVSPNKVPLSDCDNVRQPEMSSRPLKPEILMSLEP